VKWVAENQLAWGNAAEEGSIRIWDQETDQVQVTEETKSSIWSVSWSKDASQMLTGELKREEDGSKNEDNLKIWKKTEGNWRVKKSDYFPGNINYADWNATEDKICVIGNGVLIRIYNPENLAVNRELRDELIQCGAWHPKSNVIACDKKNGKLIILDGDSLEEMKTFEAHFDHVEELRWSRDGNWLATGGVDGRVKIWRTESWSLYRTILAHEGAVTGLAWHPDSESLVSVGSDGMVNIWSLESRESKSHRRSTDKNTRIRPILLCSIGTADV